jgi:cell division septal protein FtsQ
MNRRLKTKHFRKQKMRYLRRNLFILFFCAMFCSLIYFVIFSDFFNINHVNIVGTTRIPVKEIHTKIDNLLNEQTIFPINNNLIFINNFKIQQIFFADINRIYITKNFFKKTLNVHIIEKKPVAKLLFETTEELLLNKYIENMYLDETGFVFKSDLVNDSKIINIYIKQQNINIPKNLISQEKMSHFINFISYLEANKIDHFEFEYSLNTPSAIILKLNKKYKIYLTLSDDIIGAFNTSQGFYQKENKDMHTITTYIDMRYYPEKLYFK